MSRNLRIGLVGACGTGKSELATRLKTHGYEVRHIAQEHSFAPKMWKVISNPDILIFLHVSYPETLNRKNFKWTEKEFQEQLYRLRHARAHADLEIYTDKLSPDDVYNTILSFLDGL